MERRKSINNKKNTNSVSKSTEKKSDILIQIDDLMGNLENEYGPLMIQELQNRLMQTISDFRNDLNIVLNDSFEEHNKKYEKLVGSDETNRVEGEKNIPSYIADYEKNKKNK